MKNQRRTYEEIITLQDKAIEALTQANAALVMALEALKKARAEHGFPIQFPGFNKSTAAPVPLNQPYFLPQYVPNTTDGIQWTSNFNGTGKTLGLVTKGSNAMDSVGSVLAAKTVTANSLIQQAQTQQKMASMYVNALVTQKKDEQNENQSSGCISVS